MTFSNKLVSIASLPVNKMALPVKEKAKKKRLKSLGHYGQEKSCKLVLTNLKCGNNGRKKTKNEKVQFKTAFLYRDS